MGPDGTSVVLPASWNYTLVALSYVISVFGSWTTLLLVDHATMSFGVERLVATVMASVAMGACAIWAMHFTGMIAMTISSPIFFSVPVTLLSAGVSVVFCFIGAWKTVALTDARRKGSRALVHRELVSAGTWTGLGVAAMHYMGMLSMKMDVGVHMSFNWFLVALSVLIAIGAASSAFAIFYFTDSLMEQLASAFIMAVAVCGMHYTGMSACSFYRDNADHATVSLEGIDSRGIALAIALVTCSFCFIALAFLSVRLQKHKAMLVDLVEQRTQELHEEKERSDALLYSLLPRHVAEVLKEGGLPPNRIYNAASVMFMDIAGFTALCARSSPTQIVSLLNKIFNVCDLLIHVHGVTKIDMIGDCLIVCSGVPDEVEDHAVRLVDFALEALDAISTLDLSDQEVSSVDVRVGICSGPVITGVVGLEMPHFSLFGDTVNLAARMEQTSMARKIHYHGKEANVMLLSQHFHLTERDPITIKGRECEDLRTFWVDGRRASHVPNRVSSSQLLERRKTSLVGLQRPLAEYGGKKGRRSLWDSLGDVLLAPGKDTNL